MMMATHFRRPSFTLRWFSLVVHFYLLEGLPDPDPVGAVRALLGRVLPAAQAAQFTLEVTPSTVTGQIGFNVTDGTNSTIHLSGTSGVALASALNRYLHEGPGVQIDVWFTRQLMQGPLPKLGRRLQVKSPFTLSHYFNICTFGYSTVWWDWARWEREIDWMALNGVNAPLAMVGQNALWLDVFVKDFGLDKKTLLNEFFASPTCQPWHWMGNLNGYKDSPCHGTTESFLRRQLELQLKIVDRMVSLGMTPMLPGFAGHVPASLLEVYPSAKVAHLPPWHNHMRNGTYLLDPNDPLFSEIGSAYMRRQLDAMKDTGYSNNATKFHYYLADPYNEMSPPSIDPDYLRNVSLAIYHSMARVDAKAVWVAQAWFLSSAPAAKPSPSNPWGWSQLAAFLQAPPHGRLLMLDLNAVQNPVWKKTRSFLGVPFIWCAIENFGGRSGLFSTSLRKIADGPAESLAGRESNSSSIIGVGMTPEAIETNPLVFNLIAETFWHDMPIDLNAWSLNFILARYGLKSRSTTSGKVADAALRLLVSSVYNASGHQWKEQGTVGSAIAAFPSFEPQIPDTSCTPYYNTSSVEHAWSMLLSISHDLWNCSGYRYDLVALGEVVGSNRFLRLLMSLKRAYMAKDRSALKSVGQDLLELILDMDSLLQTSPSHLFGTYLLAAEQSGDTQLETIMFGASAKRMITLWGYPFLNDTFESHLSEYAYRLWAGLLRTYYKPRWDFFVQALEHSLDTGKRLDGNFSAFLAGWEQLWIANASINSSSVGTAPLGDTVEVAKTLHQKWVVSALSNYPLLFN